MVMSHGQVFRSPKHLERGRRSKHGRVAMMIEVIAVRGRAIVVKEHRPLLASLDIPEVAIVHVLTNLHASRVPLSGGLDAARHVNGVTLDHFEIG